MATEHHNIGMAGTAARELVRCGTSPKTIASFFVCNTTNSNRKFTIRHVPADGTPDDKFCLFKEQTINANTSATFDVPVFLNYGDVIDVTADAASAVVVSAYSMDSSSYSRRM